MQNPIELLRELVCIPGPPGQEEQVRKATERHIHALGYSAQTDEKGNLLVALHDSQAKPRVVLTAHLDEIALMVQQIELDGSLRVVPLGGLYPWKWGEQPVEVLTSRGSVPGVIGFGSIHTNVPESVKEQARMGALTWEHARVFTGLFPEELIADGVRPGSRVVLARERRTLLEMGHFIGSYFLDDRAPLVVWLLLLEAFKGAQLPDGVLFAATVSEEVGGEGARYLLHRLQPEICVALEIGPRVPESRFELDDQPVLWVNDSFAAMSTRDGDMLAELCKELGLAPHWLPLSRGGSDASCAAQLGSVARPITLALPTENSHGFEIMHRDAISQLVKLTEALIHRV
jgi:putative aminopeptidase FrvX